MQRTNAEWLRALSAEGPEQEAALADLLPVLERAAMFSIRRNLPTGRNLATSELENLAQDTAQEAVLLILRRLDTFRGEARFLSWASGFAILIARASVRRRLWRDVSLDRLPDGWRAPQDFAVARDGWSNPQMAAMRKAIWDVIGEVVASDLTTRQQEALNLIVLNGVATEVVEDHFKVSASALYKMTHDARRKLKAGLLKRGYTTQEILSAFSTGGTR